MAGIKHISSTQNAEIRQLEHWNRKSRDRKKSGRFVLEGLRELRLALSGGYVPEKVYFCPDILPLDKLRAIPGLGEAPAVSLTPDVYRHIAYRGKTEGIIGLFPTGEHRLQDLEFRRDSPLILIAESPEKPGNIGALLRTADAAGLDAVIIADLRGDLYNPNVIRSSIGCLFTVPVATAGSQEVVDWLEERRIRIVAATLQGATRYDQVDFNQACAIVVGTEATGLTELWTHKADAAVAIPMRGAIDSMNVSVAAAILIFEACRQRNFPS